MRFQTLMLVIAGTALLSGCNTMTKKQCEVADWRNVGMQDAMGGYSQDRINGHFDSCKETTVKIDVNQYNKGYQDGLPHYCTKTNGFNLSAANKSYPAQCGGERFEQFAYGFREGESIGVIEQEKNSIKNQIAQINQKINKSNEYRQQLVDYLKQPNVSRANQRDAQNKIRDVDEKNRDRQQKTKRLNRDIERLDIKIRDIRNAFFGYR